MSRLRNLWSRIQQEINRRHEEQVTRQERSRRRRSLLKVESLEQRVVLAVVTWDGGGGNLEWANDLNWSTDSQPTASDDVIIGDLSGTPTITVGTNVQVQSVTSDERVQINRGGFQIYFGTGLFNNGLDLDPSFLIPGQPSPSLGLSNLTLHGTSTWYDPGTIDAQITNFGTIDLSLPSNGLPGISNLSNFGTFNIDGNVITSLVTFSNMTNQVGATVRVNANVNGFNNLGTVVTTTTGNIGSINNQGTVRVESGGILSLPFQGSGSTLNAGNLEVKGTLDMFGLPVGGIGVIGSGTNLRIEDSGSFPAILSATQNSGSLYLANTTFATNISAFTNLGTLTIDGGSYSQTGGDSYTQASGSTILKNGATLNGDVTLSGGTLSGRGTVSGSTFTNSGGTLSPGSSPGLINITGDYVQTAGGVLDIEVGGTSSVTPDFDRLVVSGSASLAGTLNVSLINGFVPDVSESFVYLTAASRTGSFSTTNLPNHAAIDLLSSQYTSTSASLLGTAIITTNTNDSGSRSLRDSIDRANLGESQYIFFNIPGNNAHVISPLTELPFIQQSGVYLDGTSQAGYAGSPVIEIDGSNVATSADGLYVNASDTVIRGLSITDWPFAGIIFNGDDNILQSSYIGVHADGTSGGNASGGVWLYVGSQNIIGTDSDQSNDANEGNLISGNTTAGIYIQDASERNVIAGNIIGLNPAGTAALGSQLYGVWLFNDAADDTLIGTDGNGFSDQEERNVISGNTALGIRVDGADNTIIAGNLIGTNRAGTSMISSSQSGISLGAGTDHTRIGTNADGTSDTLERNVIVGGTGNLSGNNFGIALSGAGTTLNTVAGNYIGVGPDGSTAMPNQTGIHVELGASINLIGNGAVSEGRNIISGNVDFGILIDGVGTDSTIIDGNFIGTNAAGTAALANGEGIKILGSASNTSIGTGTYDSRNVISGNTNAGIHLTNSGTNTYVGGNYIGVDILGSNSLANLDGIVIENGVTGAVIGGNDPSERNVISGNTNNGILVSGAGTTGNSILGNYIGVNGAAVKSTVSGLVSWYTGDNTANDAVGSNHGTLQNGANYNSGGYQRNGFALDGVDDYISVPDSPSLSLTQLTLEAWVKLDSMPALGEGAVIITKGITTTSENYGLYIVNVSGALELVFEGYNGSWRQYSTTGTSLTIGEFHHVAATADGTTISLYVDGRLAKTLVQTVPLQPNSGQLQIGSAQPSYTNRFSGVIDEVGIFNRALTAKEVQQISIGGTDPVPNSDGIQISGGSTNNTIGGTAAGAGNVISGNSTNGIEIGGAATSSNLVLGNFIGTNSTGSSAIGNQTGVVINSGAHDNTIGGTTAGARNVVSGNAGDGIVVGGSGTDNNTILGNYVGADATGSGALGNYTGIIIYAGASHNTIGGTAAGARNIISANLTVGGIDISGTGTRFNSVIGNYVGLTSSGNQLGNVQNGIQIAAGAQNNIVGGLTIAERNVISGSNTGVRITGLNTSNNSLAGNFIGLNPAGDDRVNPAAGIAAVLIELGASGNVIGGLDANAGSGSRNYIAPYGRGVWINGASNNFIASNYVGQDPAGNAGYGGLAIQIDGGSTGNIIGTDGDSNGDANERNVLASGVIPRQ
ncbi:MAG: LamG domain-containing protein [Pirellulales bacterium]